VTAVLPIIDVNGGTGPLVSYAYSYPHKSSYSRLDPPIPLADAWTGENQSKLALYVHIPFCEMRCGFCNLFTQSQPPSGVVREYLNTLSQEMHVVRTQLPDARFAMFAMGGGTPTYLSPGELDTLLNSVATTLQMSFVDLPTSVETSPSTATPDRLSILGDHGIERISIGVQSFVDVESQSFGRPQQHVEVLSALDAIRSFDFPILNIDLIYGSAVQSCSSWLRSLQTALKFRPEELYLYPLYVRPETGLGRTSHHAAKHRLDLYRTARDFLLVEGYEQVSMRCFRRRICSVKNQNYSCACDGTVGLGCGARSYTQRLHYATRFAVTQPGVRAIVKDWIGQTHRELGLATHGIRLSDDEQRRRFAILNLLQNTGLDSASYVERFATSVVTDLPQLSTLLSVGWLREDSGHLLLTETGLENSDVVGPLLYSEDVCGKLREFTRL